jgi:hypothetical protein
VKKILLFAAAVIMTICAVAHTQDLDCDAADIDALLISAKPLSKSLLDEHGFGFALLVGINDYNNDFFLPKLKAPIGEIQKLEAILKDNNYVVKTLIDSQATRQNLKRWLTCLGKRAHLSDRLLFYFAGHGGDLFWVASHIGGEARNKYWERIRRAHETKADQLALCLYQHQSNSLSEMVFIEEITEWVAASSAHQQIVWIDACYSGNMNIIFQLPLQFYTYRLLNDGFFAITGIKAPVFDGLYGKFMLKGLRGAADDTLAGNSDGRVSLYELTNYADHHLRKETVANSGITFKSRYILVGSGELFLTRIGEERK